MGEYLVSPSCQWLINGSNVIANSVFSNPIDIGLSPIAHYRSSDYLVASHLVPENMVLAGLSESLAEPHALFCLQILKQILGAVAYCPAKLPMVISSSLQFRFILEGHIWVNIDQPMVTEKSLMYT